MKQEAEKLEQTYEDDMKNKEQLVNLFRKEINEQGVSSLIIMNLTPFRIGRRKKNLIEGEIQGRLFEGNKPDFSQQA